MTFLRKGEYFQYLTDASVLIENWTLFSATSTNGYFTANTNIDLVAVPGFPKRATMIIRDGAQPQVVSMVMGYHTGKACWMFGTGDDNSLFFVYLKRDKRLGSDGLDHRVAHFERFNVDGSKLHELPWEPRQIQHQQVLVPIAALNQDDEGSGEEPLP